MLSLSGILTVIGLAGALAAPCAALTAQALDSTGMPSLEQLAMEAGRAGLPGSMMQRGSAVAPGAGKFDAFRLAQDRAAIEGKLDAGTLERVADRLAEDSAPVHWRIEGKSLDTELKPKDWKAAGAGLNTTRNITMLTKLAAKLG